MTDREPFKQKSNFPWLPFCGSKFSSLSNHCPITNVHGWKIHIFTYIDNNYNLKGGPNKRILVIKTVHSTSNAHYEYARKKRNGGESASHWKIQTNLIPIVKLKLPKIDRSNPGKHYYPLDHHPIPWNKNSGYNLKLVEKWMI